MPYAAPSSGAAAVLSSLTSWYNVKNYGALGDGTTNDSTAIASAITAAGTNGTVYFPAGSYAIGTAIAPLAGQTLRGASRTQTTLLAPTTGGVNAITVTPDDVIITDLGIDGQRAVQITNGNGISNSQYCGIEIDGLRCLVQRCYIRNTRNHGIVQGGSVGSGGHDMKIDHCRIENTATVSTGTTGYHYYGIWCSGVQRPVITSNRITGWSQAIGLWYGTSDALVQGNTLINNYGYVDDAHATGRSAIEEYGNTTGACNRNRIIDNYIDGTTSHCLEIAQGNTGSVYRGNVLKNPSANHIGLTGDATGNTTDILIDGNTIVGANSTSSNVGGIALAGQAYRITIQNNIIRDLIGSSHNGAIYIGSTLVYGAVSIIGNTISNCRRAVFLNNNPDGLIVSGNTFQTTSNTALSVNSGNRHLIANNAIDTSGGNQVGISVITNGNRIVGNMISPGSSRGIYCSGNDNVIEQNSVYTTSYTNVGNIELDGAGARNMIRGNILTGANYSVLIKSTADYNVVQGNALQSNQGNTSSGTHNTTEPNHSATVTNVPTFKLIAAQTVGTSQATIAHGLGYVPTQLRITMTSAGTVWRSAVADITNVYVTADAAARTCDVYVR